MVKILGITILTFFLMLPKVHAETLIEALTNAYHHNPEVLAQRAYLASVEEKKPQAMSGFKPTIGLSGSLGSKHSETDDSSTSSSPYSAGVNLSQPIFTGFSSVYEVRSADHTIKAETANLQAKEQNVLLMSVIAYMDVVKNTAVLRLRINNEQVLSRKLEATVDRYNVGEITKTDVAQAEARLMGAQAARILAEGELEASKAYYLKIIGHAPANLEEKPDLFQSLIPQNLESAVNSAITHNPSIVSAKANLDASAENVEIIRADLLPSVSLNGSVSRSGSELSSNDHTNAMQITANLNIPLYTAGMVSSRLRGAKQVTAQRKNNLNYEIESVKETVTRNYKNLNAIKAGIRAIIAQIDSAEIALEGIEKEAEVGSRTLLDILDAEQELLDAKVSLVEAQRNEIVTLAELLVAIGQFSAHNIGLKK